MYEPVYSDNGDTLCVMDQVKDSKNTDEMWVERIALGQAVSRLSDRERKILALRFFQGKTQMEVSAEIGISQAQVSRLERIGVKFSLLLHRGKAGHISFLICRSAFFSNRDTWAWEMPISAETSIWVLP